MALDQTEAPSADPDVRHDEQINSRERVRDLAEVYTHAREVNAMLDLVSDMFPTDGDPGNTDRTFLEPACGSGNFLVAILRRKLATVSVERFGRGDGFEHRALRCLASIYGIDICEQNVALARRRLSDVICTHVERHLGVNFPTPAFASAVKAILTTNVIHADTLTDAAAIELVEYVPAEDGTFIREWSHPLDHAPDPPTLFALAAPRRDGVPVHYGELESWPGPAVAMNVDEEAA